MADDTVGSYVTFYTSLTGFSIATITWLAFPEINLFYKHYMIFFLFIASLSLIFLSIITLTIDNYDPESVKSESDYTKKYISSLQKKYLILHQILFQSSYLSIILVILFFMYSFANINVAFWFLTHISAGVVIVFILIHFLIYNNYKISIGIWKGDFIKDVFSPITISLNFAIIWLFYRIINEYCFVIAYIGGYIGTFIFFLIYYKNKNHFYFIIDSMKSEGKINENINPDKKIIKKLDLALNEESIKDFLRLNDLKKRHLIQKLIKEKINQNGKVLINPEEISLQNIKEFLIKAEEIC